MSERRRFVARHALNIRGLSASLLCRILDAPDDGVAMGAMLPGKKDHQWQDST